MYAFQQHSPETAVAAAGSVPPAGRNSAAARYKKEDSLNLTPVQIIAKIYDVALVACKKQDTDLARRAINELIAALNFDYPEISLGLYRLYDYAKRKLREGKTEEVVFLLEELRKSWGEAFRLDKHGTE
ncbi:MAG: flagellar protein FliS [Bacteroidetes bacterium]|nr:flagellar protein FliS [Bacteroidota bacterium]